MKNIKFTAYITWSKSIRIFTILPLFAIFNETEQEPKTNLQIAVHWTFFGVEVLFLKKKQLYIQCKIPQPNNLTRNKEYVIVKTNLLSYIIKDDEGEEIQVSKTRFYEPVEK